MTAQSSSAWLAAARCLALDALAVRTWSLLTTAGIDCLLIKGPVTGLRLYPERPGRRRYTDVDLLVRVEEFDAAQDVLRNNGYRWMLAAIRDGEYPWHETAWQASDSSDLVVDLHRGLAGVQNAQMLFDQLWTSRDTMDLCGTAIAIPGLAATALILALHAANPGRGLKPLDDIHRARETFDIDVWRDAAEIARACDAESGCRAGLELLDQGRQLADDLGLGGAVRADQWLGGRQRHRISVNLAMALDEPGTAAKIKHVLRRVLPSPGFVRLWDVSARRGPGWLALAYLRRVGRSVLAAPRAVIDVTIARRAVRRDQPGSWIDEVDGLSLTAAVWAWRTHRDVRKQLRCNGLTGLVVRAPRSVRDRDRRAMRAVLRALRATCLERSLLLQRFDATAGRPRDLIIAVSAPGNGFRAHAWLDGDRQPDRTLHEITRRAAPRR